MADKEIAMLPASDGVTDDTIIPVYQPGALEAAQHMTGGQFREWAEHSAKPFADQAESAADRAKAAAEKAESAGGNKNALYIILDILQRGVYIDNVSSLLMDLMAAIESGGSGDTDESGVEQFGSILNIFSGVVAIQSGAILEIE